VEVLDPLEQRDVNARVRGDLDDVLVSARIDAETMLSMTPRSTRKC